MKAFKKEELRIIKSNSSFGNYAVRISNSKIEFFFKKKQAEEFIRDYK